MLVYLPLSIQYSHIFEGDSYWYKSEDSNLDGKQLYPNEVFANFIHNTESGVTRVDTSIEEKIAKFWQYYGLN